MKKITHISWEAITWIFLIILILFAAFLPWYLADTVLKVILAFVVLAAIFWYFRSRQLYIESRSKSEKILNSHRELKKDQDMIRLLFDNLSDGILVLDEDQRIINFSPGLEKITGYLKKDTIGLKANTVLKFAANKESSLLTDMMFVPTVVSKNRLIKNTIQTKEGRKIDIEASFTSIKDKNGIKALAIIRDVTYENELVERDKEFVAVTSHQMNTPLSVMRGYLSLLIEKKAGKLSLQQKEFIALVYESTKKLIRLTENLLSISRIEQNRIELDVNQISTQQLFSELEKNIANNHIKRVTFTSKIGNIIISCDKNRIVQAVSNLIDNALKYSKENIEVTAQKEGQKILIKIKDTGIGIPAEECEKIGTKFYRCQNAIDLDNHGTGLGLFIAKTIIEKHNGRLLIESKINKGTTTLVELPLEIK